MAVVGYIHKPHSGLCCCMRWWWWWLKQTEKRLKSSKKISLSLVKKRLSAEPIHLVQHTKALPKMVRFKKYQASTDYARHIPCWSYLYTTCFMTTVLAPSILYVFVVVFVAALLLLCWVMLEYKKKIQEVRRKNLAQKISFDWRPTNHRVTRCGWGVGIVCVLLRQVAGWLALAVCCTSSVSAKHLATKRNIFFWFTIQDWLKALSQARFLFSD